MNAAQFRNVVIVVTFLGIGLGVFGLVQSRKSAIAADDNVEIETSGVWHQLPGPTHFW